MNKQKYQQIYFVFINLKKYSFQIFRKINYLNFQIKYDENEYDKYNVQYLLNCIICENKLIN